MKNDNNFNISALESRSEEKNTIPRKTSLFEYLLKKLILFNCKINIFNSNLNQKFAFLFEVQGTQIQFIKQKFWTVDINV